MAEPITVYFVGTAGAGKSTLVAAYDRWAKQHGLSTLVVNLDPGADKLPYTPDIDIRDAVSVDGIMEEHGLGPNGAQVAAADMIALNLEGLKDEIDTYRADVVLVDTPGQVELFVFRQSGRHIVSTLAPGRSVVACMVDPFLARTASGFASQLMLASTIYFRFQEPMVYLLSKADRVEPGSLEAIQGWAAEPEALQDAILREEPSMDREFAHQVSRLLEGLGLESQMIPVSAVDGSGLDDLYAMLQALVGQEEDGTPESDTFLGQDEENPGDQLN